MSYGKHEHKPTFNIKWYSEKHRYFTSHISKFNPKGQIAYIFKLLKFVWKHHTTHWYWKRPHIYIWLTYIFNKKICVDYDMFYLVLCFRHSIDTYMFLLNSCLYVLLIYYAYTINQVSTQICAIFEKLLRLCVNVTDKATCRRSMKPNTLCER